ncbi:MAG: CDGSH iron-sulfur domain-containing protein [Deltaproteobacteria bacterium]|nr:MAG: CDGSH iron-sulfur domain-containing protein [Deltaproteobacteria bacterium]
MNKAEIFAKEPVVQTLEPDTYYWCACGKTKKQPFCDGSHKDTEFTPKAFEITEQKEVALCQCRRTGTPPFCDGSHKKL